MTDFDDFLGRTENVASRPIHLEPVEGKSYQCIVCSERSIEVLFDPSSLVLYWYCINGHESKVDLDVGKIRD